MATWAEPQTVLEVGVYSRRHVKGSAGRGPRCDHDSSSSAGSLRAGRLPGDARPAQPWSGASGHQPTPRRAHRRCGGAAPRAGRGRRRGGLSESPDDLRTDCGRVLRLRRGERGGCPRRHADSRGLPLDRQRHRPRGQSLARVLPGQGRPGERLPGQRTSAEHPAHHPMVRACRTAPDPDPDRGHGVRSRPALTSPRGEGGRGAAGGAGPDPASSRSHGGLRSGTRGSRTAGPADQRTGSCRSPGGADPTGKNPAGQWGG